MIFTFDMRENCVKINAEIKGRGLHFRGSGVLYPLEGDVDYDYVLTAQHILNEDRNNDWNSAQKKINIIEIEIFDGDSFVTYKTIAKESINTSLLPIGDDFLIIKIEKGDKRFTPFLLADDLIEEKPMHLYGISGEAQDVITRLGCKCVEKNSEIVTVTTTVDNMDSLCGMSGGGVFAKNQPLMYGVLWRYAATGGEFRNVKISQVLEGKIKEALADREWAAVEFLDISACKQAMGGVYNKEFNDISDTILVNRPNNRFALEDRFVMPDFIADIQSANSSEYAENKMQDTVLSRIEFYKDEHQEYKEQLMKRYYRQLNETNSHETRIPVTSILTAERKILLIVGGPGYGKSSLLQYLTMRLLQGTMSAYDGYLPIWMPFSYMAQRYEMEVEAIVQMWFQDKKLWDRCKGYLEYAIEHKKILLIADGIDEWGDEPLQADIIIRKVKDETEAGNMIAIFSSREYGIANINSPFSSSDTYTIAALSSKQQDELVEKWVEHYNKQLPETKQTSKFLSAKLRMLKDVEHMKGNPMLLSILIGQYLQGNELPHNNIAAMECIAEQLFVKHQHSRKYQGYDYSKSFDYTTNKMLLGVLSKEMFDNYNDGCIEKAQAETLLNQYLNGQTLRRELDNARLVGDLFNHDTHQIGVIEERTGARISFINRQLQEYMMARYISVDGERAKDFVEKHAADAVFHQVLLFLFEMMPASALEGLYQVLKTVKTDDYRDYYLYKLKLEVLVKSVKAPKAFLLDEIEGYIKRLAWDTDYDLKHDILEILLDGLFNPLLMGRIEELISEYIPSASVYSDIRLSALMQVPRLTEKEREFVVRAIINGDVNNKILASNVIRKFIVGDEALLHQVNSYIKPSTMPDVVAFFIRSVLVEGIDAEKEKTLIENIEPIGQYGCFYRCEYSLFCGKKIVADEYLSALADLSFSLHDEGFRLLLKYYSADETVRSKALSSVTAPLGQHISISRDLAWRYLLSCWTNHSDVIQAVAKQLEETFPFNHGNTYELWDELRKHEISQELRQVITEWAVNCDDRNIWSAESWIVNTIANDPRIKAKLLRLLEKQTSWLHIIAHPLMNNWGKDKDVIDRLQRYLDEEPIERSSWMAEYAYDIYEGDNVRTKAFLDKCLESEKADMQKARAIYQYISRYKEEFAEKYIPRVLRDDIAMTDHVLGSKWSYLEAIIGNYPEREDVKDYLQKNYANDYRFAGQIIAKYHGTPLASKMLGKWHHLDMRLRLMMIHKISDMSSIDEKLEKVLHTFNQEGNPYVLCDTVLCLVDHLRRKGRNEEVSKIAEEVYDTSQVTTESTYKMRFCIFLMSHRMDEYVEQVMPRSGSKEYEFLQTELFYNDSPYVEKTIVDEAYYLLKDEMANLKKMVSEKNIDSFIVFFSKYVDPTSDAARIIVEYIRDHKDKVEDANILMFLKKVGNEKPLLKELVLRHIDNEKNDMVATVAQIVASDFAEDEDIHKLLTLDDWKWYDDPISRLSLNCTLNRNTDKLKEIYRKNMKDGYLLTNDYAYNNFVISQADANSLIKNLKDNLSMLRGAHVYRLLVALLIERLKRDKELADKLYNELISADNAMMRVGYYSILSNAGVKSTEIRHWRGQQHEHLNEYGHDVVTNRDRQLIAAIQ